MNPNQALALTQLEDIAAAPNSPLGITEVYPCGDGESLRADITLETRLFPKKQGGIEFRKREPLRIRIPPSFPFRAPSLDFRHHDHSGRAHVNWGNHLCLYQTSETEWVPSDGMYGFFSRVDWWFKAAALGELDPEDAPLHPPANFPTESVWFIPYVDTPEVRVGAGNWVGWAGLKKHSEQKYDIAEWSTDKEIFDGHEAIPAILLDQPLAFEYPDKVSKLFDLLETRGIERGKLDDLFITEAFHTESGNPFDIVIGSPMRRKSAGSPVTQHLAVWRIPADTMDLLRSAFAESEARSEHIKSFVNWSLSASTAWCRVLENRPEIVIRRDEETPSSWLLGKTILLLGAGALGSPIGEDIVRAGAERLHVVDNSTVKPGILVRQRYAKRDIARSKADCLAKRLNDLSLGCEVIPHFHDVRHELQKYVDLGSIDLIIDATASQLVSHHLESMSASGVLSAPLTSVSVSAGAKHGMAIVRMPEFRGGPIEIARRSKLAVFSQNQVGESAAAFWPERAEETVFQPEPGCSEPTFVGSASAVGFQASGLLTLALRRVSELESAEASCDFLPGPGLHEARECEGTLSFVFKPSAEYPEDIHGYTVRLDAAAQASIEAEIARSKREVGNRVETGGLLFGEIDDSHQVIRLDRATMPPSDSEASAAQFLCGTNGTKELAQSIDLMTKGSSRFVGIWHTHPVSQPKPSTDDLQAMVQLLVEQDATPRHVVMMIVGFSASSPTPKFYLYRRRDIEAFVLAYLKARGLAR